MGNILILLIRYRYYLLLPIAIAEGPALSVLVGFLCKTGAFNLLLVYPILLVGDVCGDSLYYILGRYGRSRKLEALSKWLGFTSRALVKAKTFALSNPIRMISLSKLILGVGVTGLFLAGRVKVPYGHFLKICFFTSLISLAFYLAIGWCFGFFYEKISRYLDYVSSLIVIISLVIGLYYFTKARLGKL